MSIAKNIFSNWSNIALSILAVFITYPLLTRVLGEEQYGIWLYISSAINYFYLLQMGVPLANVRYIAKYHASQEIEKTNTVLSSNLIFFSAAALVTALGGCILSLYIDRAFIISDSFIAVARTATIIAALNISLSFMMSMFEGVLQALQKFIYLNAIKNVLIVLRLLLIYIYVAYQDGIVVLSWIMLAIALIQSISLYLYARRCMPSMKISLSNVNMDVFKDISKFSVNVMFLQVAGALSLQSSPIIIGSVISVVAIVSFSVANNILVYFTQFVIGISQALLPKFSAMDAKGDINALAHSYIKFSRLTFMVVAPICFFLIISGGDFISLWMGDKFRHVSGGVLSILTLSYLFFLVQRAVAFPICMAMSRMRFLSLLMLVASLANIALSIGLGFRYGLNGVAWGTTIPNLVTVVGIVWFMRKALNLDLHQYLVQSLLLPGLVCLVFVVSLLVARQFVPQDSYAGIAIAMLAASGIYVGTLKLTCFPQGFRALLAAE